MLIIMYVYHIIPNTPILLQRGHQEFAKKQLLVSNSFLKNYKRLISFDHLDSSKRNHLTELACGSLILPLLAGRALINHQ